MATVSNQPPFSPFDGGELYEAKTYANKEEAAQQRKMQEIVQKSLPPEPQVSVSVKASEITSKFQPEHPTTKMCEFIAKYGDK